MNYLDSEVAIVKSEVLTTNIRVLLNEMNEILSGETLFLSNVMLSSLFHIGEGENLNEL